MEGIGASARRALRECVARAVTRTSRSLKASSEDFVRFMGVRPLVALLEEVNKLAIVQSIAEQSWCVGRRVDTQKNEISSVFDVTLQIAFF